MTTEDRNEELWVADAAFWDLVRRGEYDTPEARALAERVRDLRRRRSIEIGGGDEPPADEERA